MSQVIEVRLYPTNSKELLHQSFTSANSHREAIELAISSWSGGLGVLTSMERIEDVDERTQARIAWRYAYLIGLQDEEGQPDREALALLFATYKEKGQEEVQEAEVEEE